MKRVLLISTVHPATDSRIMYKIAPSLKEHYEVYCALPGIQTGFPAGLRLIRLPRFERLLPRLLLSLPIALFKCLRIKPDVMHIFAPEIIPIAMFCQWLGIEVIYEVQENLYKKFGIKRYNNAWLFRKLFRYFDKLARKHFACIFTDDAYLLEYRNLVRPHTVVHNYVSLPNIDTIKHADVPARGPVFFYLGVISMERCIDTIIRALAALKQSCPDFHLHLFGPLRVSARELEVIPGYEKVKSHMTFHGYTDHKTAMRYAGNALAGIALLKPVADYPESYPTKLFEYMALKLPVITSDFLIYRNIVENSRAGFCISPTDAEALCEKLKWCIDQENARIEMGSNGRATVEKHYNWASEEAVLLSFYNDMLRS